MTRAYLQHFLSEVRAVRGTGAGTPETAYYPPLSNLVNSVGTLLKPRVRAVMTLKNMGAGLPDGGFFTQDQFDRNTNEVITPLSPARGVIEVKPPSQAVDDTAASKQIDKYWNKYKLVLITNLRDWLLLGQRGGKRVALERYVLANDEPTFWHLCAEPENAEKENGAAFTDFIARVMRHAAPLSEPQDLAWFLASYAREARYRLERVQPAGGQQLAALKESIEAALGVNFEGEKGVHFFQSTLVQTLFYGIFAAWVLKRRDGKGGAFDWKSAAWYLHVPMINALFAQLAQPTRLQALNLEEVLDWTADALNRVEQEAFFSKFQEQHSVQYFYEPFLEEFDPELRKELGVWYTPTEIVKFMVARVEQVLQKDLGLSEGLADPNVIVLDPCCGTGAYLVEVLRHIAARLRDRGEAALAAQELKVAATTRLFGFELLPAPFVIAHLQLGVLLHELGAPLGKSADGLDERATIYLTNALTGWEPLDEPKTKVLPFPEFALERDAADAVKQTRKILVILGNPPYNGYAGVATGEERSLSEAYRQTKDGPQPQGQGLNELYVRFFRMAERQIVEKTGYGIVCYISNYSWLSGHSHPAMRERFLECFDGIWIDNLHGDKYRTGKLTPIGDPDPSAFSTPQNREGIQVGTAITTLVRRNQASHGAMPYQREWWGRAKLQDLLAASDEVDNLSYETLAPQRQIGWAFVPTSLSTDYLSWPRLPELFPVSFPGVKTSRDGALVDIDREALVARMTRYFDPAVSDAAIANEMSELMVDSQRFDASATRKSLVALGVGSGRLMRYCYRPFDVRWLYWHPQTKLLDEKRPDYVPQVFDGNMWLFTTGRTRKDVPEPAYATSLLTDLNFQDSGARGIPLRLREGGDDLLSQEQVERDNTSDPAKAYLNAIGATSSDLLYHSLAVLHAPIYRSTNAAALRHDWPRIPLPASRTSLRRSADLGKQVAQLLDTETPVPSVTAGKLRPDVRKVAIVSRAEGGALKPNESRLTAGWGHVGKGGATMPGRGKAVLRKPADDELSLSSQTLDIWLNDSAYWKNVPQSAWDYTLGGYAVMKKWLSYREYSILGRALTMDELREFTAMARRITALIALEDELNASYLDINGATYKS